MEPIEEKQAKEVRQLPHFKADLLKPLRIIDFDYSFYKKAEILVEFVFPKSVIPGHVNRIDGDNFSFFRDGEISNTQILGMALLAGYLGLEIKIRPFNRLISIIYIKKSENKKDFESFLLSLSKSIKENFL